MPQYQLVVRRGPRAGETFELKSQTVIIGRDSTADIIINDPEVSRNHCRLILDRSYYLQDLGSTNGTFIDGQRLGGEPVRLANGQIIQLGSNVTLLHQEIESSDEIVSTYVTDADPEATPSESSAPAPETPAAATLPERDDMLPSFDGPAPVAEPPASMPEATPQPVYSEQPGFPQPERPYDDGNGGGFFNNDSAPMGSGMPWANWTQRQWMIAVGVLLILLLCACCLFATTVVMLIRPDLVGLSSAGLALPPL